MTKVAMTFYDGQKKSCIVSKVLHKAKKKEYKGDIIELLFRSSFESKFRGFRCTPREAIVIADSLIHAVVIYNSTKPRGKKKC